MAVKCGRSPQFSERFCKRSCATGFISDDLVDGSPDTAIEVELPEPVAGAKKEEESSFFSTGVSSTRLQAVKHLTTVSTAFFIFFRHFS